MPVTATIHHGSLPTITSGPTRSRGPRGALDSLTVEILTAADTWEEDAESLGYAYEQKIPGFHSMWVQTIDPDTENDLVSLVKAQCIGLLRDDEKRKRKLSVAGHEIAVGPDERIILVWDTAEQGEETDGTPVDRVKRRVPKLETSGTNIGEPVYKTITTPEGTGDRFNVREAILVVTDTYFTTTLPDTTVIGTAVAPPNPPEPPPFIWGSYTEPLRGNFPHGWVLDDRQVEEHFDDGVNGLWEVTDVTGYYQIATPD